MDFHGKVAWVTGASSGIGEHLALGLSRRGAQLILSGRRIEALQRVAEAIGGEALILPFEATDYAALPVIAERARGWRGRIDILINNAGVSQRSLALDTAFDVYRRLMEIDFFAPVRLTQLVLPWMVERKSGHLVAISSIAGKLGAPLRTGYCAAKHALTGYFDALRAEVEAAYGVKVSVVTPGSVRTAIAARALTADGSPRGRSDENIDNGMAPERAADIILDGVAKGQREIPVAEGVESAALEMRRQNPEALFDFLAQEGARLAAARDDGCALDPSKVNR
jgi:short-subunit dehydrogenase